MKITTAQEYRNKSQNEEEISIKSLIDEIEDKLKDKNLRIYINGSSYSEGVIQNTIERYKKAGWSIERLPDVNDIQYQCYYKVYDFSY